MPRPIADVVFGSTHSHTAAPWIHDLGKLVVRVCVGPALAFGHGLGKLPPSDRFIAGVADMGFPVPALFSWMAGLSEFAGGLCFALGLFTRPATFFMACTVGTAFFIRHANDPFRAKELAFVFLAVAVAFFFIGAGRFSVDAWVRRRLDRRRRP